MLKKNLYIWRKSWLNIRLAKPRKNFRVHFDPFYKWGHCIRNIRKLVLTSLNPILNLLFKKFVQAWKCVMLIINAESSILQRLRKKKVDHFWWNGANSSSGLRYTLFLYKHKVYKVLGKLPPNPSSNANPKPNPDPERGTIFLGGNFPDTGL